MGGARSRTLPRSSIPAHLRQPTERLTRVDVIGSITTFFITERREELLDVFRPAERFRQHAHPRGYVTNDRKLYAKLSGDLNCLPSHTLIQGYAFSSYPLLGRLLLAPHPGSCERLQGSARAQT